MNKIYKIAIFILLSVTAAGSLAQDKNENRKPLSFYKVIWERNLFRSLVKKPEPEIRPGIKPEIEKEIKENIELNDLSLKGVIFNDGDYQAAIEDKKTGKFSYLREGELIEGAKIVTILKDRVILDYEGQITTLILR